MYVVASVSVFAEQSTKRYLPASQGQANTGSGSRWSVLNEWCGAGQGEEDPISGPFVCSC